MTGVRNGALTEMQEGTQQFMESYIRARAVAPLEPGSPGLPPQERRACWEFCLWMDEFLGNLIRTRAVDREAAGQLARLKWILLRGSYVFASAEPELRAEQARFSELCVIIADAFGVIVDDTEDLRDTCGAMYGVNPLNERGHSNLPALAEALVSENRLRGWKDWEMATSPIAWVHFVTDSISGDHDPLAMDQEPNMKSLDARTPTGDSYAALLPDPGSITEYPALDLGIACQRERLTPEASLFALARYNSVPKTVASETMGLSKRDKDAASRELLAATPALQARLAPYQNGSRPVSRPTDRE